MSSSLSEQDHQFIMLWMTGKLGEGQVSQRKDRDHDVYAYYMRRRTNSGTVSYTLEITQEAFDHDGRATIVENLDRQNVGEKLLADPATHLRYCDGGIIVPSPTQPKRT